MTKATTTAIGPQTRVNGRIVGDSTVDVYGYVRGEIDLRDTLTVHEEGVVDGDVAADNIIVNGTVRGQLHVRNHLVLGASARVVATIKTHLFTVEEGATFSGDIETHIGGDESAKPLNYAGGNRRNNRQTNRFVGSTSTNSFASRTFNRPDEAKPQAEAAEETSEPQNDEQTESYGSYIEEHVHQAAAQFNADGTSQSQTTTAVLVLDHPVEEDRSEGSDSYGYSGSDSSDDSEYAASEEVDGNTDSYNEAQYVDEDQEISEGYEAEDHETEGDLSEESDSEYEEDDDVEDYESSESDDEEDEDLKKKKLSLEGTATNQYSRTVRSHLRRKRKKKK